MGSGPDPAELLRRHVPILRYDSQEPYFADAASEWTDNPGNELRDAAGNVLAAATPKSGQATLSLDFLGPGQYANGHAAARGDLIGDPSHDYVAQARALHAQPQYANRVYGHAAQDRNGRLWIAYWFFYFYNDFNLIGPLIKAGLHEGDWEMIQLRLDAPGEQPDLAVYAQHAHAEQRPWNKVQRVGDQPVVYPARGSHASYFSADVHWTGAWFDFADATRPGPPLDLHIISDGAGVDGWAIWPGRWGGTTPPAGGINPLDDSSPQGPGGHAQYQHPETLVQKADDHAAALAAQPPGVAAAAPGPAPAPTFSTAAAGPDLEITYDTHVDNPAGLVVTIGDPTDRRPPEVHRIPIDAPAGTATVPGAAASAGPSADADHPRTVRVSIATEDAAASPAATPSAG
jgi:hypothetical protein